MKRNLNKLSLSKKTISKLSELKKEVILGGERTKNCPTIFNGCPLQTNEQDTNGNYYC